jgi:hypothetical protein
MRPFCLDRGRGQAAFAPLAANVQRYLLLVLALLVALPAARAEVCDPTVFQGPYGFWLNGNTTLGGPVRRVAVVGRLVLDVSGNLSGFLSASFTGLILGNPVTGKYEAHSDCSVAWSLQDDSGNFQHFAGNMSADGGYVAFRQADPGGAENGVLMRSSNHCSEVSLAGKFDLTASGSTIDVDTALESGRISLSGLLTADGGGRLSFATGPGAALIAGSYEVEDDCFVELALGLIGGGNEPAAMHFRAILVGQGSEAFGIQTDPGTAVALRLVSRK